MSFAVLLINYRTARHFSLGQVASRAGISRTYLYHLEQGQRQAPSVRVALALIRALDLHGEERECLVQSFNALTNGYIEPNLDGTSAPDLRQMATQLINNSRVPAVNRDHLWRLLAWNQPAVDLFELSHQMFEHHQHHLIHILFDPTYRCRFPYWEAMVRQRLADYNFFTQHLTSSLDYRALQYSLKRLPDFLRISSTVAIPATPIPAHVFLMRHSRFGIMTLYAATMLFSSRSDMSNIFYLPANEETTQIFRQQGWHPASLCNEQLER